MQKYFILHFLLSATALLAQVQSQQWFSWKGYVKDLPGLNAYGNFDSIATSNLIHIRMDLKARLSEHLSARLGVRTRLYTGSLIGRTPGFSDAVAAEPGWRGLSATWLDRGSAVGHTVIDRILLQYSMQRWDITMGRQRINWGIHNVWNPNDIFNAYNFLDFDYEERPGSDAMRFVRPLPGDASLELAWVPGRDRNRHTAAIRYRLNRGGYDLQWISGIYRSDFVIGGGWAGSIGENGFKGEASYFHPRRRWVDTAGIFVASLMADRTLKGAWYLSASWLYNSQPSGLIASSGISSLLTAKSLFPFRYSWMVACSKSIATVHTITVSVVSGSRDATVILLPSYAWNLSDAFDLDAVVQSFFSDAGGPWRLQGASYYLRGRWSF